MSFQPTLTAEVLPPGLRRHVGNDAPIALRTMGAKLLVPASPHDALCLLYLLSHDEDEGVRLQAAETVASLPDKVALPGLKDESVPSEVLGWLVLNLGDQSDAHIEALALNPSTPDDALAAIAGACSPRVAEVLSQNQLRLLRSEAYLRALLANPRLLASIRDATADFAVRSGIYWEDVQALVDAHKRVHGEKPPEPPGETAESLLRDMHEELAEENEEGDELEEEKRLTLTQRIMKMSVSEKIKLATLGNKEARSLLLRDTNKLVALAAIESPRITEGEIIAICQSRTAQEDVIRSISNNRDWMKLYAVKLNLARNPKTPPATALRLVPHLREKDLREIQGSKNVPHVVQTAARGLLMKKRGKGG